MMNVPDLEQPTNSSNASCLVCNKEMRKDNLQRHMKTIHQKPCRTCDKIYRSTQERNIHQKNVNHVEFAKKSIRLSRNVMYTKKVVDKIFEHHTLKKIF